ncbi:CD99 antigen-like protein 2 isoform X1 [Sphaerodactylus townsendi]|uniref:CD99 antigen-like protein 2 isoform X1 n=1 Tax=Sphaerodactylus townsendi TaxID=933632 RepID=UPI002026AED4|nr:CD99 antigen-like protein 2 isoform X1 [Sphaerodactylus townsendi]
MAEKLSRPRLLFLLLLTIAALSERGYADDWSLEDALTDQPTKRPTHKPKKLSSSGTGDFDLSDYFDDPLETTTKPAKVTTGPYPKKPDDSRWNVQYTTTTRHPKTTKTPPKKHPTKDPMDFDLSDALKDSDDGQGGGAPIVNPGGGSKGRGGRGGKPGISDEDLAGILDDGKYQPDKKKGGSGGGSSDSNYNEGALIETGTIAGIVSGLAMALIGAVSSYISYQQKKFCFSIQQGLNAEYVKGENMEAVVTEEPQVKYSVLEPQSAEPPPPQENAKV